MLGKGPPSQKCRLKRSRWGQMTSLLYWESERGRRKEGATKAKNEGEWEGKKGNFILKRAWPFSSSLSLCLLRLFLSRLVRTPSLIWVRLFHAERRETAALVWSVRIPQIVSPHCSSFKVASRKKKKWQQDGGGRGWREAGRKGDGMEVERKERKWQLVVGEITKVLFYTTVGTEQCQKWLFPHLCTLRREGGEER